jgi:exodeoxyribonuclease VII small subunit
VNRGLKRVTKTKESPEFQFETALAELESLVETLEQGELSLEQSLQQFERGVKLTRACQQALKSAEQRVDMLVSGAEDSETAPYSGQD